VQCAYLMAFLRRVKALHGLCRLEQVYDFWSG